MHKQEFLAALRDALSGLPQESRDERLNFYAEMIDDRMEEGLSEADAIGELGSVESIAAQIVADMPLTALIKKKAGGARRLRSGEIILLVLGSPIWLSLLIVAFSVALALYISLWAIILSLWTVEISLWGSALGVAVGGFSYLFLGHALPGIVIIGAALVCIGISIFGFWGCKAAVKGTVLLTKKLIFKIKSTFAGKGASH